MFNSHANVLTKWLPGWNRLLNRPACQIKKVSVALASGFYSAMEIKFYEDVWIKKKQFKYDDLSQFGVDEFMLSGSAIRMEISVSWKNSLDKHDNTDWINTITCRKLIWIH